MTEDEAYELLSTHRARENKEKPGEFYCGAISCPHQYTAPPSRAWQAHRRHWALLIADTTADSARAVRLLHRRSTTIPLTCCECEKPWPCPTVEVLRQARSARD